MGYQNMIPLDEKANKNISDRYQKKTYTKGETCIYGNTLYKAKANIDTAEEWNAAHWEKTNLETIRSEMAAELSSLNAKSTFHRINVSGAVTPPSSDKFYTGIKVQIPANSYFSVTAFAAYENAPVTWIGLGESDTQIALCYRNANAGYNHASVSYSGFADKPLTLYVWAQWGNSSINSAAVTGYYVTQ